MIDRGDPSEPNLVGRLLPATKRLFEISVADFEIFLASTLPNPSVISESIAIEIIPIATEAELASMLSAHGVLKGMKWHYAPRGSRSMAALPLRRATSNGDTDWLLIEPHSQIIEYFLTSAWRSLELVRGLALLATTQIASPATIARSLMELAASIWFGTCSIRDQWDLIKHRRSLSHVIDWKEFLALREIMSSLTFSVRFDQADEGWTLISNKLPAINPTKLINEISALGNSRFTKNYEFLCNSVHPSFFSRQPFMGPPNVHGTGTHSVRQVSSIGINSDAFNYSQISEIVASSLLDSLSIIRESLETLLRMADDIVLSANLASLSIFDTWRLLERPDRNSLCPCNSGRKFKSCIHNWESSFPVMRDLSEVMKPS